MRRTRLNVVPPMSKPLMIKSEVKVASVSESLVQTDEPKSSKQMSAKQMPVTVSLASNVIDVTLSKESRAHRVRRLQEEAKSLAREQVTEFEAALAEVSRMAEEIADGGEIYHIGVREICRRLAEELPRNLQTLQAIVKKA
jgi:hypothetical protein